MSFCQSPEKEIASDRSTAADVEPNFVMPVAYDGSTVVVVTGSQCSLI